MTTDPTTPSPARIYDFLLGGDNNVEVDRRVAEGLRSAFPEVSEWAWTNRGFHQRATLWLAEQAGIRQFLDIGSGLPTQVNTHDVVRRVSDDATVVYVDNDAAVAAQATDLLAGDAHTAFVVGDLRKTDELLRNPEVRSRIDFARPVGILATAVLHFVGDDEQPGAITDRLKAEMAPGSYLALSHGTVDKLPAARATEAAKSYQSASARPHSRTQEEVARFFDGLELVPPYPGAEPGVCYGGMWGAEDPNIADDDASRQLYVGVARKP